MIDRNNEMRILKEQGMSYRQLAKMYGISFQRVAQILGKMNVSYFKKVTEQQCVFKGIRDYMNNNEISLSELIRRIYGNYHTQWANRVRLYLNGTNEFKKSFIDKVLEVTGLTYEEAFRRD